jgi:hypothetical protein
MDQEGIVMGGRELRRREGEGNKWREEERHRWIH